MKLARAANASMTETARLVCIGCGQEQSELAADFRCTNCRDLLEVNCRVFDDRRDLESGGNLKALWVRRRTSLAPADLSGVWRFRELLPIVARIDEVVTLHEGNTPIYELPRSARSAGVNGLLAKHQGMNPTGSFKDTGMTAALSVAREKGFRWVACASTGNTSASMAAYAARAGMRSLVLIPEGKIAWGKLAQSLEYGALTCQLRADFDGCMRVLGEVIHRYPIYLLNSVNPYRIEGQKTAAVELMEQLEWRVPDHIVAPGGNLGNSSALGKGLLEMVKLGLIERLPRLHVIQAEGANALVRTVRETGGKRLISVAAETMATAIRIGNPASWKKAVRVLEATCGMVEQVSEAEIAIAKAEIGEDGIGCEPASAATLAGLKKLVAQGHVKPDEKTVLILTGHVLKDPEYTFKFHQGSLLEGEDSGRKLERELRQHQRAPVVLDAKADEVLRVLESNS